MSSVASPKRTKPKPPGDNERDTVRVAQRDALRTSRFDVVTSFFMALIWFIGVFVTMLLIVWMLSGKPAPKVIQIAPEQPVGRGDNPEGFERDFEPPGSEEVEELLEPTLEDTIEAVTDAVSTVAASLDTMDATTDSDNIGTGRGDSRPPGPEGTDDTVPRYERWQLNFAARDIKAYALQLDYYGIELAAVGGGVQGVDYAFNLSTQPTKRHLDDSASEQRLYFMWTSPSPLQRYDMTLLQQAGVDLAGGRSQIRFIPPELEQKLYEAEMTYAQAQGHNSVTEIAKTVFESTGNGQGEYSFEVIAQRYRQPR